MANFSVELEDYPRVIEPTVNRIECQETMDGVLRHAVLCRVDSALIATVTALPTSATHFFGPHADLSRCRYFLAYGPTGHLVAVCVSDGAGWTASELPEEVNGLPILFPSVRLVFKDERARDVFLYYLSGVKTGSYLNPAMAQAIDGLAEPPRIVPVAPLPPTPVAG